MGKSDNKLPAVEVKILSREYGTLPWSRDSEQMTTFDVNGTLLVFVESWTDNLTHAAWFRPGPNTEINDPVDDALAYNRAFWVNEGRGPAVSKKRWAALKAEFDSAIDAAIKAYEEANDNEECAKCGAGIGEYEPDATLCVYCDPTIDTEE